MQNFYRHLFTLVLFTVLSFEISAQQNKDYEDQAAEIRNEVWGWDIPEFTKYSIPPEYANESKVIIARHLELFADSKKRFKYYGIAMSVTREVMMTEIYREAILLNDKSAVQEYSEISYTKLEKKSGFDFKISNVYLGVRVTKKDGKTVEIKADDIVLTKDDKQEKQAKVAIPDLQEGDIIDYYFARMINMSAYTSIPPYNLEFYGSYPILHASFNMEIGKKYAIEYRSYNGAPEIKTSIGSEDENILKASKKNIAPLKESGLWTAAYQQLPIIRINIGIGGKRLAERQKGEVYKNQDSEQFLEDKLKVLASRKLTRPYSIGNYNIADEAMDKIMKNRRSMSPDSLAREVFYIFRYNQFLEGARKTLSFDKLIGLPQLTLEENDATEFLSQYMEHYEAKNLLIYSPLNRGPKPKEIMQSADLHNFIMVTGEIPRYYGFSTIFTVPEYLPSYFEGMKNAVTINHHINNYADKYRHGLTNIPFSVAENNKRTERMIVSFTPGNTKLDVKRQTIVTGHQKQSLQQNLILFEDYYNYERLFFDDELALLERFREDKKTKKMADEVEASFNKARIENKDAFLEEAKNYYELEISYMTDQKIDNYGVRHNNPDFIYSSSYKIENLIRKAGDNFIIEIGKLQGTQLNLENDSRIRKLDVFGPYARSYRYQISFAIPDGYTALGIDSLNKSIVTPAGSFTVNAILNDNNKLIIDINKVFQNAYEPVANWPYMLQFLDAAHQWSDSKIMIKKS